MAALGSNASMSPSDLAVLISSAGFILSISASMFISGMRMGEMRADLKDAINRLSKIEGMFTMKLKDEHGQHND